MKEFEDLLTEIKRPLGDVNQNRQVALRSEKYTTWKTSWPVRPGNFKDMLWSGDEAEPAAPAVTKAATASASVLTDTEPKVDESWLVGTNAQIAKKVDLIFCKGNFFLEMS